MAATNGMKRINRKEIAMTKYCPLTDLPVVKADCETCEYNQIDGYDPQTGEITSDDFKALDAESLDDEQLTDFYNTLYPLEVL
jgi:hypothetical protein